MANGNGTFNSDTTNWYKWAAQQGVACFFLLLLSWFTASQVIVPMRDNQKALTDSIITANQKHAEAAVTNAAANQANASTNAAISEHMRDTKTILQQIRDDQRRGAWNDTSSTKRPGS